MAAGWKGVQGAGQEEEPARARSPNAREAGAMAAEQGEGEASPNANAIAPTKTAAMHSRSPRAMWLGQQAGNHKQHAIQLMCSLEQSTQGQLRPVQGGTTST